MKASEFIERMQDLIAQHGDLEVRATVYGCGLNAPATVDIWEYLPHCKKAFYVDTEDADE